MPKEVRELTFVIKAVPRGLTNVVSPLTSTLVGSTIGSEFNIEGPFVNHFS